MRSLLPILLCLPGAVPAPAETPSFVVILADDLGYGDIGPFGSAINRTPALDRMAREGMRLTSFYMAAPVCTPSRAALMTGCYPMRVGLARGSRHAVLFPGDPHGLHPQEITVAEALRDAGYATGCFGKWHLGDQPGFLPVDQGFDTWRGIPYSNDMWPRNRSWQFPPLPLMRDRMVAATVDTGQEQADLCRRFTEEAVRFIRRNRERPFFAYLPHAFVHHPRFARPRFLEREGVPGDETPERRAARAQIEEVDWSVGEILRALEECGLASKTLVLFASDNGGARGCVNAPLRGGKGSTYEGGMRVPALVRWPGSVPAGSESGALLTAMDILPTFVSLARGKLPAGRILDGRDVSEVLRGGAFSDPAPRTFYYYRQKQLRAVRHGPWKLHAGGELYHLEEDAGEQRNRAAGEAQVVRRLQALLEAARKDLGDGELEGSGVRPPGVRSHSRTLLPRAGARGEAAYAPTLNLPRSAR